jgi:hypothetical protein
MSEYIRILTLDGMKYSAYYWSTPFQKNNALLPSANYSLLRGTQAVREGRNDARTVIPWNTQENVRSPDSDIASSRSAERIEGSVNR